MRKFLMFQGITVNNHQQQYFHAAYNSKRCVLLHAPHKFLMNIDVKKITSAETCFCQTGLNRFKPWFKPLLAETCKPWFKV